MSGGNTILEIEFPAQGIPLNSLPGALKLSVEVPASAIAELSADPDRRFVNCSLMFKAPAHRVPCRARLIPVEGANVEAPVFIGFADVRDD